MSSKSTQKPGKFPFIQTHILSYTSSKGGGGTSVAVMALLQDETYRLFTTNEAEKGSLPAWKANKLPTDHQVAHGDQGLMLYLDRKAKYGELIRSNEILYFSADEGELVGHRSEITGTPAEEVPAPAEEVVISRGDTEVRVPADSQLAADAVAAMTAPGATPAPAPAPPVAPGPAPVAPVPTAGPRGRKAGAGGETQHREGSVQGMTIDQMRAEFTDITGQPAPSNSIHYMRKMLMAARRGKKDFKSRPTKVPTMTLTIDEIRDLASGGLGKLKGDKAQAIADKIAAFSNANPIEAPKK